MEKEHQPPPGINHIPAKPVRVTATRQPTEKADVESTRWLLLNYTREDGFHCPRCPLVIKDPEEAIIHLEMEINKALATLGRPAQ